VPFVVETFGGIHHLVLDLLRKISNYVVYMMRLFLLLFFSNYIKMISVVDMMFKAHEYKVMPYGKA